MELVGLVMALERGSGISCGLEILGVGVLGVGVRGGCVLDVGEVKRRGLLIG